ncbi:Glutamyl-tRNA(Gln) amidotransferase subunit E [uncultured archaeon]|nr:Glutamyl-tRNA(Gln) amidotransferase subunit E [uncultured archaeon]
MQKADYEKLGLKAGLEVHQQLDTGKLFIRTPSTLTEESDFTIERKLRPVASELGEYDKTAIDAYKRNETFYYSGKKENISLVELDEEPPQPIDEEALKTTLEVALLCESTPVSKIIPMRKTVIDGSNTSGFQRTVLISMGGNFEIKSDAEKKGVKKIGVQTIVLEEDAARPMKKEAGKVFYNLDRLGIPLIELATDPDIRTPQEAIETAKKIGEIMRLTCKTKRGKGTIRQDVNVSIAEGARCEIKGCQELELIGTVVEKEAERQVDLIALKKKLAEKFPKAKERAEIFGEGKEVSKIFAQTEAKFVKGKNVYGMRIAHAKGMLGEKVGAKRFGSELSAYAKATGVSGLLHRDELPNYGITQKEADDVCRALTCGAEDNFVLIVAEKERAQKAFDAIRERFLVAFDRIPSETRGALEDGSSEYQRPISGEARMYPETDIPFRTIEAKALTAISKGLPKSVAEREKLYTKIGLSTNHIEEMKLSNYARFFESTVEEGANAKVLAALLLQTLTELRRSGVEVDKVSLEEIKALALAESTGKIAKSALANAVEALAKGKTIEEVLSGNTTAKVDTKAIEKKVIEIVSKNSTLVKAKGMGSIGPLMGDLMREPSLKGVDGKILSDLLRKEISAMK